ncbi:helix-turn-helix domain-containing protein [Laceyella putida]|uniref:Helix-turn-helix domain-containing protein n=1 Tax=Laceyella putida TaxID=110101 RepID=A0ABW2RRS9_9BACL
MIRTEQEYKKLKAKVEKQEQLLQEERKKLEEQGFTEQMIQIAIGFAENFHLNDKREVEEYERVMRGEFDPYTCKLGEIGTHLIKLRLWRGLTQSELANRMGVSNSQVSRDERYEYSGASMERIEQVLKALDIELMFAAPQIVEVAKGREEYASGQDEMAAAKQEKQAG